ncbi:TlpA family protein disulfide reductase [Spirosoma aerophilum]
MKSFILFTQIWLVCLVTLPTHCLVAQSSSTSAVIHYKGTIPYFLYYQDEFLDEHEVFFDLRDKTTSKHTIVLPLKKSLLIRFSGNNDQLPVLIKPKDTLTIEPLQGRIRGGKGQEANFYPFLEKQQVSMGIPDFWSIEWTPKLKFDVLMDEFRRLRDKRLAIADSLREAAQLSTKFHQQATIEIQSAYLQALLLPFVKPHTNGFTARNLPTWYLDTLSRYKSFFTHDDLLTGNSLTYRYCLNNYVKYLSFRTQQVDSQEGDYQTANQQLSGKHRDFALFSIVKIYLKETGASIKKSSLLNQYREDIREQGYVNNLDATLESKERERNEVVTASEFVNQKLDMVSGAQITWQQILSSNKANVVYLDMWASWCGPCRKEMPNSVSLANQFKGKPVKFVYVSIDSDRPKWLAALKTLKLPIARAQHYRLAPDSKLAKLLTKGSIPKYVVINKDSRIHTTDGPRPSEEQTKKLLVGLTD